MKTVVHLALAASLVAVGVSAQPHGHQHAHLHKKNVASPAEKREPDVVTAYAVGPTVTAYQLAGESIPKQDAKQGIEDGVYVVIGESKPSFSPPPPPPPPETTSSEAPESTLALAAQFYEEKETSSSSSSSSPEPSPEPTPSTSSEAPPPPKTTEAAKEEKKKGGGGGDGSSLSGGKGLDAEFPDGKIKCSEFPSDYGALAIDWLSIKGWVGIQRTPKYSIGDKAISYIETAIKGEGCTSNSFCSYACPEGYQKTQWPAAQGDTLQSIGGLWCNDDGYLELSRPEHPTLCEKGTGGVFLQNDLDDISCVCRTDYPGDEGMTIPTVPKPGQKVALTNPSSENYYVWNDLPTTAQYYVNKKGYSVEDSCVWTSSLDPKGAGNWAPINIGTGKADDGNTYISIFPNWPTSDAKLDFNIEITGDINGKCSYINGKFSNGDETGCTTTLTGTKGEAVIRFFSGSK